MCGVFWLPSAMNGQCRLTPILGSTYTTGNCGNLRFQQLVGQVTTAYGTCSGNTFLSPLLPERITTSLTQAPPLPLPLHPNPAWDKINLELPETYPFKIWVRDLYGRLIHFQEITFSGPQAIDVNEFPEGMYFITVLGANKQYSIAKFIKISIL